VFWGLKIRRYYICVVEWTYGDTVCVSEWIYGGPVCGE